MGIFRSRFTLDILEDKIPFVVGDKVRCRLRDGMTIVDATVDSELMRHDECPDLGYECIDAKDGSRFFANGKYMTFR